MTKSEFIWVLVRLIGVGLLALAVWTLIGFLSGMTLLLSGGVPATGSMTVPFITSLLQLCLEMFLGLYLIIDGSYLYSILDRE